MKPINGYDGYFISEIGEVYSIRPQDGSFDKGRIRGLMYKIAYREDKDGYYDVYITANDGIRRHKRVHRLVAEAFIPNYNNYPVVNHEDGNVKNNTVDNLSWCTISENTLHAYRILGVGPGKPVKVKNRQTNKVFNFTSISECAEFINVPASTLNQNLNDKGIYTNYLYEVKFLE